MATRLKTIQYGIPTLATVTDNALTAMTVITAYIPEWSGTVVFKKCIVEVNFQQGATSTAGNYTSRRIDVSVGGAGATSYTNANLYTGSGQLTDVPYAADCTAHFAANWTTGTSKTVAVSVLIDGTGTTLVWGNVHATLYITYEYDDTQTTQIKTVYIPLNAPVAALATSKPGSATATIPALDTELPETSKTYRSMFVVCQGNVNNTASTTDSTLQMQIESYTQYTSASLEMGTTSDYWARFVWTNKYYDSAGTAQGIGMDTSISRGFYLWGSVARHNHQQVYLVVTYEFDSSGTSGCFNSVMLPLNMAKLGGIDNTSSDYVRGTTELWIEEPATITTKQMAAYMFWDQAAAVVSPLMRLGTGSFITYTDAAAVMCGGNGAMVRNDSAFSLARGKNTITFDAYSSDATDRMYGLDGFVIINYTSDKPTQGYGAANHTVWWNSTKAYDGATATNRLITAFAPGIPESNYFISCIGTHEKMMTNTTGSLSVVNLWTEKTTGEGNADLLPVNNVYTQTDAESGLHHFVSCALRYFKRYPTDPTPGLLDFETTRRWLSIVLATSHYYMDVFFTYHTITYTVSGTVSGYADADGAGLTIKYYNNAGVYIGTSTTTAGGAHTLTWYDNVTPVFADCYENSTHTGRSIEAVAA